MEMTSLAKGLRTLRLANILSIIFAVVGVVGGIVMVFSGALAVGLGATGDKGPFVTAGVAGLVTGISLIFLLVAGIMQIVALVRASKIHTGYKIALIFVLAGMVCSILIALLPFPDVVAKVLKALPKVITCLVVYFVIDTTVIFLESRGDNLLAAKGTNVRTMYIVCTCILVIADFVTFIPALATVVGFIAMVATIVELVALFKYIGFLGKSATALEK